MDTVEFREYCLTKAKVTEGTPFGETVLVFKVAGKIFALMSLATVVSDETGIVESATLRLSVNPQYDAVVLAAAKTWLYRPASLDGSPVKYRKMIQIVLRPTR